MTSPLIVVLSAPEAASALGSAAHSGPERPTNKLLAAIRERMDFVESFMAVGNFVIAVHLLAFRTEAVDPKNENGQVDRGCPDASLRLRRAGDKSCL
jgi:hypothetical protein